MNFGTIFKTALSNTMRSKLRTFLTALAIGIGAFTLTLTSGIGAGINNYITKMVDSMGESDELYVMPQSSLGGGFGSSEPAEYDPEDTQTMGAYGNASLSEKDLEKIRAIEHVKEVTPVVFVQPEYIESVDGKKLAITQFGMPVEVDSLEMTAGKRPAKDAEEIAIPEKWVESMGVDSAEELVGKEVSLGIMNQRQELRTVTATISGVSGETISGSGSNPTPSQSLSDTLHKEQRSGLDVDLPETYVQATVVVDDMAANEEAVKADLVKMDMLGLTLEDQLGMISGIIQAITWVFIGFALVALLAASFGIVNTLLMSVQERTREIGLMKALGMTPGKIFTLFSMEAIVIGLIGSLAGMALGAVLGLIANAALVSGPLSGVAGLTLFAVNPLSLFLIVLLIVVIAFISGSLPARRAAVKDPIDALRYE